MKLDFCLASLLAVALFAAPVAGQTVIGMFDFESSTVDDLPIGPDQFFLVDDGGTDPVRLRTAGPGGVHEDPFGPPGNKSVVINNVTAGATQPQMIFASSFPDDASKFQNGTIEFDLYMELPEDSDGLPPPDEFWSYVNFRAGYGDENRNFISGVIGDTAISVSFRNQLAGDPLQNFPGLFDDGNQFPAGSPAVQPDTPTHVEFRILPPNPNDPFPNGAFELRLDGNLVTWGGTDTQQPWIPMSALPPEAAPGINMISFVGAAPGGARVWIDNIKITQIPEPTALVLCSVLLSLATFGRYRKA